MGIEAVYYLKDNNSPEYEPKIVKPGTYYCIDYPHKCKGVQKVLFKNTELKPCPKCGGLVLFST